MFSLLSSLCTHCQGPKDLVFLEDRKSHPCTGLEYKRVEPAAALVTTDDMDLGPVARSKVGPNFKWASLPTPVSLFFHGLAPQYVSVGALDMHVTGSKSELSGRNQSKQQS